MKFIDTTDYSLGSFGNPTQLDVLTLEAYMLAPSDEVLRQQIRTTTGIEFANRHRDLLPGDFFRDLCQESLNAKPLQMVQEQSLAPFARGVIAGTILNHAVGATLEGLKGNSVSYAVSELSRRFGYGYSRATIHNLWREFKTVSHYWAAYVSAAIFNSPGARPFPCTVNSLATRFASLVNLPAPGDLRKREFFLANAFDSIAVSSSRPCLAGPQSSSFLNHFRKDAGFLSRIDHPGSAGIIRRPTGWCSNARKIYSPTPGPRGHGMEQEHAL
jgi:hypothetical protein